MQTAFGPALVCAPLEATARHLFTTRSWMLGTASTARDGEDGWREVADAIGVAADDLVHAHQVHGAGVLVAEHALPRSAEADIILSANPQVAVAVQAADCLPLLIADRRSGGVAAAHAGWRGLLERVPQAAVGALESAFDSRPADLTVAAGPAIGACCYEVGDEVRRRFEEAGFAPEAIGRWFLAAPVATAVNPSIAAVRRPPRADHWFFDTWAAVRDQLESAGVPAAQVHISRLCSASHAGAFCSYRRDGVGAGRLVAVIRPRPPGP